MEKSRSKTYKRCKGIGLFAMEDIEKYDYVIEYVGKNEYKRRENNYIMNINGMNLWINGDKNLHNT
jgi:SET domain-containing protein